MATAADPPTAAQTAEPTVTATGYGAGRWRWHEEQRRQSKGQLETVDRGNLLEEFTVACAWDVGRPRVWVHLGAAAGGVRREHATRQRTQRHTAAVRVRQRMRQ
jgi:hypothetical protein